MLHTVIHLQKLPDRIQRLYSCTHWSSCPGSGACSTSLDLLIRGHRARVCVAGEGRPRVLLVVMWKELSKIFTIDLPCDLTVADSFVSIKFRQRRKNGCSVWDCYKHREEIHTMILWMYKATNTMNTIFRNPCGKIHVCMTLVSPSSTHHYETPVKIYLFFFSF